MLLRYMYQLNIKLCLACKNYDQLLISPNTINHHYCLSEIGIAGNVVFLWRSFVQTPASEYVYMYAEQVFVQFCTIVWDY